MRKISEFTDVLDAGRTEVVLLQEVCEEQAGISQSLEQERLDDRWL